MNNFASDDTDSSIDFFVSSVQDYFTVRAFLVGERLDLRTLERAQCLALNPMVLKVSREGIAVLLRYGLVVLFNVSPLEEQSFLETLRPFINQPLAQPEQETEVVYIKADAPKDAIIGNSMTIQKVTIDRLQIIADVLAKNLILSHYEAEVSKHFDYIEPLANDLKTKVAAAVTPANYWVTSAACS
jgi:uncharacterized Rmd1/YagE family protein